MYSDGGGRLKEGRYQLSFTTGGLFDQHAPVVAACFLKNRDWTQTRHQVRADNLLQVRTDSAALRMSREIITRLQQLDDQQLEFLVDANAQDSSSLLWVAACRRFALIRDFALEVLRERALLLQWQLTLQEFDTFVDAKALWHPELEELAASTRRKLRQNLFRMLREAGLVSDQLQIQPAVLSPRLVQLLARGGAEQFMIFPVSDQQIQRWLQCA